MAQSLVQKVALITGSSRGIGAATAVEFARQGAKVIITGRDTLGLEKTKLECARAGLTEKDIYTAPVDFLEFERVRKVVDAASQHFGGLDILVNNAGIGPGIATLEDVTSEEFDKLFNANVKAPLMTSQFCLPYLKKSKGSIINVSSLAAEVPVPGVGPLYSMSKAAMNMMTKTQSIELCRYGVRVHSVCPAFIKTDIHGIPESEKEMIYKMMGRHHPIGRAGEPEDVAKVITFLASDGASFMTGSKIFVDGGLNNTITMSQKSLDDMQEKINLDE